MKIYLYDHLATNKNEFTSIGSIGKQEIEAVCKKNNIKIVPDEENDDKSRFSADLWLLHHKNPSEFLDPSTINQDIECNQVFIFVTTVSEVEGEHTVIEHNGKSRALFFVKDMSMLQKEENLKNLCSLSFANAKKMIEAQSAYEIGWEEDPFFTQYDIPIAVYILCQCYLHLYYLHNKPPETTHPQILELLKNQDLFDRPSDGKFKTAKSSNWWKGAISITESEDLCWGKIKSKGEKQWHSLIKGQDDRANAWEDLISQVNKEEDVEISFENVETYYLKMHTILSAK
jgi:hypothetical protein